MKKNREMFSGLTAWLVSACFFLGCFANKQLLEKISKLGNSHILIYGITLVLFCLAFLVCMWLTGRMKGKQSYSDGNAAGQKILFSVLLLSQIPFWIICVANETDQVSSVAGRYGWHTHPLIFGIILFLAELLILTWMYAKISVPGRDGEWIVWLTYVVLTVLILYSMYTPNIFGRGEQSDSYHCHAYFNSVYNIYQGMPYTHNVTSIYGHYALFFKIPMKLLHGDFRAFVMMLAMVGTLAHVCAFLTLQLLVESRVLRIAGALAIAFPILGMRGGYYWQVWPHRIVFPMLLLLYGAVILKKNYRGFISMAGGYLICLFAVLWNTETGIFLAISWAAMYVSRYFSENRVKIGKLLINIAVHVAGIVFSVLGAYGTVNLYNILKHSPVNSLEDFLVPLLSSNYMEGVLHLDMPLYPCAYMAVITLFLMGTSVGLSGWFQEEKKQCWNRELIFLLSVGALGCLVYYINRPAYHNLDCVALPAAILSAYFGQYGLRFIRNKEWKNFGKISSTHVFQAGVGLICTAAVLAMSTGTVLQFAQNSQIKENFHDMEDFEGLAAQVAEMVPENTPAFGINIPEIYSLLQRRTECFTMDFSDMLVRPDSLKELKDQLEHAEVRGAFTGKSSMKIWKRNDPETYRWFREHYILKDTISFQQEEFQYYIEK
ncbi:hypothetical protein DW073_08130 [Ruminococcus sp. AF45-4BH]|nr:hypothetical protein DW073_08130 [Ruminococcus sp. AF45-4BH]